jgi:hypothetical protein
MAENQNTETRRPEVCTRCWTVKSNTGECVCDALDRN